MLNVYLIEILSLYDACIDGITSKLVFHREIENWLEHKMCLSEYNSFVNFEPIEWLRSNLSHLINLSTTFLFELFYPNGSKSMSKLLYKNDHVCLCVEGGVRPMDASQFISVTHLCMSIIVASRQFRNSVEEDRPLCHVLHQAVMQCS